MDVTYAVPLSTLDGMGSVTTTTNEQIQLVVSPDPAQLKPQTTQTLDLGKDVSLSVSFLASSESGDGPLPSVEPNPFGVFPACYSSWAHATLTGLLSERLC